MHRMLLLLIKGGTSGKIRTCFACQLQPHGAEIVERFFSVLIACAFAQPVLAP